jgi:hypothetical protein
MRLSIARARPTLPRRRVYQSFACRLINLTLDHQINYDCDKLKNSTFAVQLTGPLCYGCS